MIGLAELADPYGLASAPLLDGSGAIVDPLLSVNLDGPGSVEHAARAAHASDRILVGVTRQPTHPLAAALDLTLTSAEATDRALITCEPAQALAHIEGEARRNPQAATVLADLLRWSGNLAVADALNAESLAYSTLLAGPEFARWLSTRTRRPVPPSAEPVLLHRDADVLTITLNRPERRNAYGREVRDALVAALQLASQAGLDVVLRGNGASFCAGGDLDEFGTTPDPATAHFIRTRAGAGRLMHELAPRTEAQLQGPCVGAGVELPAFARTVRAAEGTTFRLPEVGMGLIPGAGGTVSIPARIGRWRTLFLALTGHALELTTALRWGLCDAAQVR